MNRVLRHLAGTVLRRTRLCYWPVRVKSGVAAGARWTLYRGPPTGAADLRSNCSAH